ncbi:MAG: serine/threonine protein kinase, partial [Polyangiales bacterium]
VKVLSPGRTASEVDRARFETEVMLAARLKHPNVVSVFDAGEDDGRPYIVMELVPGGSLARWVGDPKIETRAIVKVVAKLARALQAAHEKGIVHRDLKPDNVLLDEAGEPCLTDFGIAKSLFDRQDLTREGRPIGTVQYMSPEQANGELAHIGPLSDVYGLGATLYHLLAGRSPFTGANDLVVMAKIVGNDPHPPSRHARELLHREIPLDLDTICLKALEKQASRRYASAGAMAEDLERFLEGEAISARPLGPIEKATQMLRRNRAAMVSSFAAMTVVAVLFGALAAVALEGVARSNRALVDRGLQDALHQAATLERAIRVNMLQGRADQARALMRQLNSDPAAGEIRVVRTDRQLAYVDHETRKQVQAYLDRPDVVEKIRKEFPTMLPAIDDLRRVAFPKIDQVTGSPAMVTVRNEEWNKTLITGKAQHYEETLAGTPYMVVLWPVVTAPECEVCHGEVGNDAYRGVERVRAVLVVRRSQADLAKTLHENRIAAVRVGAVTAVTMILLMIFFSRVLGIRPRAEVFGAVGKKRT